MYATYALEQTALASKQYRHLGIGGKLLELLARPNVSERLLVCIVAFAVEHTHGACSEAKHTTHMRPFVHCRLFSCCQWDRIMIIFNSTFL